MEDIDDLLENYEPGKPENKPDVTKQLMEIKESRMKNAMEHIKKQQEQQETINKINMISNPLMLYQQFVEQSTAMQNLIAENSKLTSKVDYLENKIKQLITSQIEKRKDEKRIELSKDDVTINTINNP
jgi:LytS/YehU family sensor histidine kinase